VHGPQLCPVSTIPLPFPYTVAASVVPWLVGVDDWLASYGTTATEKIELDPTSREERLRQPVAIYGCNGTEFSYVIFTEQRNFQRRNGNGIVETGHYSP